MGTERNELREALKQTATILHRADVEFALYGSYALWAHGATESDHDVDFMVTESDADRAAEVLRDAGLHVERPPEDWLFKVFIDGVSVDVIHRVVGAPVSRTLLRHSDVIPVLSVPMPVLWPTDVFVAKLNSMTEHYCDFAPLVAAARAVRERIDWRRLRTETAENDFAAAFLYLADRLQLTRSAPRSKVLEMVRALRSRHGSR